ncbi:hypothetical protein MVES1_001980 [Malassezia vespertilionis]|uniref:Rab-GAP TBC domain-containing protein n=1 Tax=Malassezia vespertilionis TaxID=2020962 RepID=A0A2N1JBJ9_9BASI|nr:uncharacterized protein MVES1_001980 [Malassezia vespertilionis]PKI83931.1 hypothetical protein MVES_001875 [Malassezia vespertilionis]WFD06626.1 hypothetical protein MVES1_001980 [Malassezia vespertilionis]
MVSTAAPSEPQSEENDFVEVALDAVVESPERQPCSLNLDLLRHSYKRGGRSQLNLSAHKSTDCLPAPCLKQSRSLSASHYDDMVLDPLSIDTSSVQASLYMRRERKVKGRYRSRLESPRKQPLALSMDDLTLKNMHKCSDGAVTDPGITMTVADAQGDFVVVQSPRAMQYRMPVSRNNFGIDLVQGKRASSLRDPVVFEHNGSNGNALGTLSEPVSPCYSRSETPLPDSLPDTKHDTSEPSAPAAPPIPPLPTPAGGSSLTRMPHLPPKSRKEEKKHLAEFTTMMEQSIAAEKKRDEETASLNKQREEGEKARRRIWEEEILPCWTRARQEPRYRELWWRGIPPSLRARLWSRACGNNLMLPHDLFAKAVALAKDALEHDQMPSFLCDAVEEDIANTLPSLRLFNHPDAPLYWEFRDILYAFLFVRADEAAQRMGTDTLALEKLNEHFVLYVPGTANLAAMLLINMPAEQALVALINLIGKLHWLRALYQLERSPVRNEETISYKEVYAFERVFNTLIAEQFPVVYANLQKHDIRASTFLRFWIRSMFVPWLDIDVVAQLWDIILLEDSSAALYRIAIALFQLLVPRLYAHDPAELASILQGTNKGVLHVWYREWPVPPKDETPPKDRIYAQYAMSEASVYRALDEQNSWWKDSTLQRLLDRELH